MYTVTYVYCNTVYITIHKKVKTITLKNCTVLSDQKVSGGTPKNRLLDAMYL